MKREIATWPPHAIDIRQIHLGHQPYGEPNHPLQFPGATLEGLTLDGLQFIVHPVLVLL